jgi:transmembrane sensor
LQEVVNETDKEKRIILPDSSIVVLSPAGKISYTYPFIQNNRREIYLSGDAFFDIQKDTLNPLFVYTNGLATRVVGTSFLIKTTVNEVKVLVRTGRVAVTPIKSKNAASENTKELLLIPNQQALFSTRDNAILKTIIDFPDEIKKIKKEEVLSFENRPITEVFEILEKVYGVPIIYDRTAMAKCLLHVEFTNESLFQKLDIITQTIGGSYTVTDGQVMISGNGCN